MQNISVEEIKKRLNEGAKINLVDVREPDEHAEFNIGGILIPLGKIQTMQVDELDDDAQPLPETEWAGILNIG